MNFTRNFLLLICLGIAGLSSFAQNKCTIPLNDAVKQGKLKNGMTYYIMHNEEPKDRASFYFVQNVGAILEEDSQDGLAHFLEHMAFNGLKNFPGKNMLNYLEKNGILFGRDINAYTAFDETVYNISNIPVGNEGLLDSTLLVLHDWSGGLLLEGKEIESERGVIHEEWRTRKDVNWRLREKSTATMFNNSKYAKRDIIGSMDIIDNFEHSELINYYEKWYRPDLQALVVVGDVDVNQIEAKVKALFSNIPMPENATKRPYFHIEDYKELEYVAAKDKEATSLTIMWLFSKDAAKVKNEATLRADMASNIFSSMLGNRIQEKTKKLECPALGMSLGSFPLSRTQKGDYMYISPKKGKELEAFTATQIELERVIRHGFAATELERAKTQIQRNNESYYANIEKVTNDRWATVIGDFYLKAIPLPSVEWEKSFQEKIISEITMEEVLSNLKNYSNVNNSAFILSGPDSEEYNYPTKEELLAAVAKVKSMEIEAYVDNAGNSPLVEKDLKAAKIIESSDIEGFGAKSYTLENGAKVVILPTDYSKDEIGLSAFSFGGTSLISNKDIVSAAVVSSLTNLSGLGEFDATQLEKKLTGKIAYVSPQLDEIVEGLQGSASPKDFETFMQLVYLSFENPRFDREAFDAQVAKWNEQAINSKVDNASALKDSIILANSNYSDRTFLFNEEAINRINYERAVEIYKERFTDASDFTFIFVGNINTEEHLPMIQKYIGNISSTNRKESFVDHKIGPAKGITSNIFERKMTVPKTTVSYNLQGDFKYSLKNKMMVNIISQLLSKRYMVTIREEEGGSYGVRVGHSVSKLPSAEYSISIKFDGDPEKSARLTEIVKEEITKLTKESCNADDLTEIKNNFIKNREEQELQNYFWMNALENKLMENENFTNKEKYNQLVNSIDSKAILKFAKKILKEANRVEVIMNPEK